ncbi:MAG: 2OG-Fe dioxygenase family protein [Chloroflexi bacterium]|nr:2OG-Fe dioxygenase family protein [Chloroflexota bacterium]
MDTILKEHQISTDLRKNKYALVTGEEYPIHLAFTEELEELKASWENLEGDKYIKDGGTFRQRRFGLFYFLPSNGELILMPPAHYFQSTETNTYAGGIKRHFAPLTEEFSKNKFLLDLIKFNFQYFPVEVQLTEQAWEVDVHQFRIIGKKDEEGQPTPEGIHHDGDDFNVIHLMQRKNVKGGENKVYDNEKNLLASTTLTDFMDSVFVWDPYVMHGVSPIYPEDSTQPAIRDVMVIGYNSKPDLQRPT